MPTHIEEARRSSVIDEDVVAHVGDEKFRRMSTVPDIVDITSDASKATAAEHRMTLLQGLKLYPKAVGWSVLLSCAIIMEGFDIILIGNLYALPSFKRHYGERLSNGSYEIPAAWQSGISNGALVGEIIGLFLNGIIAERIGYRKTMIGALAATAAFVFIIFFSESLVTLLVGEILIGIPWGVFQTLSTTYAAEVVPVALRAYLTTFVNLCWVLGQIICSGVLKATNTRDDKWGYKIPLALQWMWPLPLMIGIYFAPDSPWWFVRKERHSDARKALLRLTSRNKNPDFNADESIAMMQHTNELEKAASSGASYWDCFKGTDLRRTEIVCMVWAIQTLCGATFMSFSTYFYQQAGLDQSSSFTFTLIQFALGGVGTILSWFLMRWFGRRTLYLVGQVTMTTLLLLIGFLGLISRSNSGAQWAIGSLLLVYTFAYDCTVGPACYSLVAELPSTRLRTKSVVLARNCFNVAGLIANILTPRMLNPSSWDWGAKAGFFWAGSCFLCLVWTFFRLPEPKGRTYAELDVLFEQKVSARKFKTTLVDPFLSARARRASMSEQSGKEATADMQKVDSSQQ